MALCEEFLLLKVTSINDVWLRAVGRRRRRRGFGRSLGGACTAGY